METKKSQHLFLLSLSLVLLFLAFPIQKTQAGSSEENLEKIEELRESVVEQREVVRGRSSALNSCRRQCKKDCRSSGQTSCSKDICDASSCSFEKRTYEEAKDNLNLMREDIESRESYSEEEQDSSEVDNESAKNHIQEKKKDMGLAHLLGVGTTGYLGYKAYVNWGCCSTSNVACCNWAGVYTAMTVLATAQTVKIFRQTEKFSDTERAICEADPNVPCDRDSFCEQNPDSFSCKEECDRNPNLLRCKSECERNPERAHCRRGSNPAPDGELPPSCRNQGHQCQRIREFTEDPNLNEEDIPEFLAETFKPKEGWKDKGNPFKAKGFSYDKLSPAQKAKIDTELKALNSENKKLLEVEEEESEDQAKADIKEGVTGFSKQEAVRSTASLTGNSLGRALKKKTGLADQMKKMLKQFYGDGGSGKGDPLSKKSVSHGSDVIGVVEDNIFKMAHRRHRILDHKKTFLKTSY